MHECCWLLVLQKASVLTSASPPEYYIPCWDVCYVLQAVYVRTGSSMFEHGYKVNLEAGCDHAFLLCMILILHAYRQQDGVVCPNAGEKSGNGAVAGLASK